MKKIIGVTGGVGAGKSTVLNVLKDEYNAQIILTDNIAHEIMLPGRKCYDAVLKEFGEEILSKDGTIDKKKFGQKVFNSKENTKKVNSIVHPEVKECVKKLIEKSNSDFIIIESALLIEAGFKEICDEIWYVYVSTQERVKRLYEQRGYSEVKSYSIIYNQLSHEQFGRLSDRLIDNSSSREYTRRQIHEIMEELDKKESIS